jgi:hypothetical protein
MTRYISNPDNLKLMMNMLKEKSRNIQFEAFHVFKVKTLFPLIHRSTILMTYRVSISPFTLLKTPVAPLCLVQLR